MRITANQVTWVRLLLLPLPVAMIYQGTPAWMLGALAVYILLGLTDALDGILARRYGSTPLGAVLDPIVDKIFLVAAYLPVADHQMVSTAFVSAVFVRELAVTVLRSIALEERFGFRTSRVAKLKTTVQMAGAGLLLLVWLFPRDPVIWTLLGAIAAGSLVPPLVALLRGKVPGWRGAWGAVLFGMSFVARLVLDRPQTLTVLMSVILVFTMLSGLEYFWGMRRVLAGRLRRLPIEGLRVAGLSLALPLLLIPAIELPGDPAFLIMGILAAELAVGGLDNSLVQAGRRRGAWPDLLRAAVQGVAGAVLLLFLRGAATPAWVYVPCWGALLVTLADLGARLLRNHDVFLIPAAPRASAPEPPRAEARSAR